ncbi:MAG: hypothetical protein AAF721_04800 [Myxococcota bacterium]
MTQNASIDVVGLLTIDVASELRKLSRAQLQGPWQIPAELVRRAIRDSATTVKVTTGRQRVEASDNGKGLHAEHLQWTAVLIDTNRSNEDRHRALTALEASGALSLLAIAGLPPKHVRITSVRDGQRATLEFQEGRAPWVSTEPDAGADETVVLLITTDIDRKRAIEWLSGAARFSPVPVLVDGKSMNAGFLETFGPQPLHQPLRGQIAIPATGDTAHTWLLEHGLVTGHVAVPDAPCFEAAVELGGKTTELSAARLREKMEPRVPALVDQAVGHLLRLAQSAPGMPEAARARIARLVLIACRKNLRRPAAKQVPAFRVVDAESDRCVSLTALKDAAAVDGTLPALYPTQRPDRFALGSVPVVIADEGERSLLAEVLGVRFRPPELRDDAGPVLAAWRRLVVGTGRALSGIAEVVRHPLRPQLIDDTALNPAELALLQAMRRHAARGRHRVVGDVRMCDGTGPIRRRPGNPPRLLLPRGNPTVAAAVVAVSREPAWIYPVWLALTGGEALPPRTLRGPWVARS